MKKIIHLVIALTTLTMLGSCGSLKLVGDYKTDSVEPHRYKTTVYFWGLKTKPDIKANCDSKCICQVKTTLNAKQIIISSITLGIVIPMNIQWECCPPPLKENKVE